MNLASKEPIGVLIVDDSPFMRLTLQKLLTKDPEIRVLDVARNGREGIEKIKTLHPQVVTLDIEMPEIDGLQALDEIMRWQPTPVIMLSAMTTAGAEATMKALDLGAFDVVAKPTGATANDLQTNVQELIEKIKAAAGVSPKQLANRKRPSTPGVINTQGQGSNFSKPRPTTPLNARKSRSISQYELVAIGTSTGGPSALQTVLPQLPADFPVPVIVAQHMPAGFTAQLALRLNGLCPLEVREAVDGDVLQAGVIYIAPAGKQIEVAKKASQLVVTISTEAPIPTLYKPSVDVLFLSLAKELGRRTLGVVMTGMGNDGTRGMQKIKEAGGSSIVEAEETCVVYGMPRSIVEAGLADRVVPLGEIGKCIVESVYGR